jgi:uncharacterized protein (DUF427 family)
VAKPLGLRDEQWIELVPSPKWVRVMSSGLVIANSRRVKLLRENGHVPVYYFLQEDVRMDLLNASSRTDYSPAKGPILYWSIKINNRVVEDAAWSYLDPPADVSEIKNLLAFEWNKVDSWFEENEEVFVHARDPYKRIEVLLSSRHVQVVLNSETIGDSYNPVVLFEPGHPDRYYLPKLDVRMDLFRPSEKVSRCPYKGQANYYSFNVETSEFADIVWTYRHPTLEASKIAGLLSFYNERVDAIFLDGEKQLKPEKRRR